MLFVFNITKTKENYNLKTIKLQLYSFVAQFSRVDLIAATLVVYLMVKKLDGNKL